MICKPCPPCRILVGVTSKSKQPSLKKAGFFYAYELMGLAAREWIYAKKRVKKFLKSKHETITCKENRIIFTYTRRVNIDNDERETEEHTLY